LLLADFSSSNPQQIDLSRFGFLLMKTLVLLSLSATNGISFDFPSFSYSDQMLQFAKFEKTKERRLATEHGYGFSIGNP
jgi:hypothetical protein